MRFLVLITFAALAAGEVINPRPITLPILRDTTSLRSDIIFQKAINVLQDNTAEAKSVDGVVVYDITKAGRVVKKWTFDLKNAKYYEGPPQNVKVDTTFSVSDADLVHIAMGQIDIKMALLKGKIKVAGSYFVAVKFGRTLKKLKAKYGIKNIRIE